MDVEKHFLYIEPMQEQCRFLTFILICLQVSLSIELKQEIWADWPLTYYCLTDKPNFDRKN